MVLVPVSTMMVDSGDGVNRHEYCYHAFLRYRSAETCQVQSVCV